MSLFVCNVFLALLNFNEAPDLVRDRDSWNQECTGKGENIYSQLYTRFLPRGFGYGQKYTQYVVFIVSLCHGVSQELRY